MMIKRSATVPMKESDMEWVRDYLSHDAATNHEDLQRVDHWLVAEYVYTDSAEVDVEVYEVVGVDATPPDREGFPMDDYDATVDMLQSTGFPVDDY